MTHNIPLLREVIHHPRFRKGALSTKFLSEEFPKGFTGHELTAEEEFKLLAVSGLIQAQRDIRDQSWIDKHVSIPNSWELFVDYGKILKENESPKAVPVKMTLDNRGQFMASINGKSATVEADWMLEAPLVKAKVNDEMIYVQYLEPLPLGFRLSFLGSKYDVTVKNGLQYELSQHMIPKKKIDYNKMILAPMPGVMVSVAVKPGDVVAEGSEIGVVEAMKMQNVLRASQAGIVKAVNVKGGSSVQADEILVELEDVSTGKK